MTEFEQAIYKLAQEIEEKLKGGSIFGVPIDTITDPKILDRVRLVSAYELGKWETNDKFPSGTFAEWLND